MWSGVFIDFLVWLLSLSVYTCSDVTDIFGKTPLDLAKQFSALKWLNTSSLS